jgi:hypothetical protein
MWNLENPAKSSGIPHIRGRFNARNVLKDDVSDANNSDDGTRDPFPPVVTNND